MNMKRLTLILKKLMLVSVLSGLITSNILTLLNNEFHQTAFESLTKILGSVVTQETLSSILINSPTQTYTVIKASNEKLSTDYATLKVNYVKLLAFTEGKDYATLKSEYEELKKNHSELTASNERLSTEYVALTGKYDELQKNHSELTASNEKLVMDYATLIGKHDELLKNNIALEANKLSQLNTLRRVSDSIYQRLMYRIIRVAGSLTKFIPILGDILDIGMITMEVKDDCQTFDDLNELRWHSHLGMQDKPEVCLY